MAARTTSTPRSSTRQRPGKPKVAEPAPEYASQEVSDAWRTALPVWYQLVSEWHAQPQRQDFARYIADDQERTVRRAYAIAEARAQVARPIAAAEIAGHNEATQIIEPHREAVTLMIEGPAAGEPTLSMEAVPGDPDTFA